MAVEKRNIFLNNTKTSLPYAYPPRGFPSGKYQERDKVKHATFLENKLRACIAKSSTKKKAVAIRHKEGVYLEFSGAPEHDLAIKSLEDRRKGIRLLNVKTVETTEIIKATVYIPAGEESCFLNKIKAYASEVTKKGIPQNNDLIRSIEDIQMATLESLWEGNPTDIPDEVAQWCEIWVRYDSKSLEDSQSKFINSCAELEIVVGSNEIVFPERKVRLIKANKEQLINLIYAYEYIAEFRRAPEPTSFFEQLSGIGQQEWVEDVLNRCTFIDSNSTICLLDTGVNSIHPLLSQAVKDESTIQSVNPSWGTYDNKGHGTGMAGIALYCDLKDNLINSDVIEINHKIESVKILPPEGDNPRELYGAITEQAVSLAEISNPKAERVVCMAVTASDYNTDDGSPTSWSAAIDNITSGANEKGIPKRLFFISAGNVIPKEFETIKYHEANSLHCVENPGQSWNALTVGAFVANDVKITDPTYKDFRPVADVGELSPYSSTSVTWDPKWPIKPEILLDGGNVMTNDSDYSGCEDLSLLTTSSNHMTRPFSTICATSSATAQGAWMAAQIYAEYPNIWPETVRALLVHSARWTKKMRAQFCQDDTKKRELKQLLRSCGYGVPNLQKAIQCLNNSVNLIIQGELQPFTKEHMNEMHMHKIPWPKDVLQSLGATKAEIRVTLSYFIEPGPESIGWKDKYRYPSCGLRFDVINSNETQEDFEKRISAKMREDKEDRGDGDSRKWYLGVANRNVGSIHSDFCEDTAVGLCEANYIAVYPVVGWWRTRGYLGKYDEKIRYSLVVSIETPKTETDLYTPIITQIQIAPIIENTISF